MKYNKSKTYLLPLLSELIDLDPSFIKYLKNTYMFNNAITDKKCIALLYDFSFKIPDFTLYEHRLINNALFIKSYDVGNQVLYIFEFPKEYEQEYDYFYNGKYSKFGKDAKELILKFWYSVYPNNKLVVNILLDIKNILYKDEKLKKQLEKELDVKIENDQELGSIIEIDDETFVLEQMWNEV